MNEDSETTEEQIQLTLPKSMVKQLRGSAIHDRNTAKTKRGEKDAQRIISTLTYYLDEHEDRE